MSTATRTPVKTILFQPASEFCTTHPPRDMVYGFGDTWTHQHRDRLRVCHTSGRSTPRTTTAHTDPRSRCWQKTCQSSGSTTQCGWSGNDGPSRWKTC